MSIPSEIIAALIGGIVVLIGQYLVRAKTTAETGKIDVDTFATMRDQLDKMEDKIVALRERVEALEVETSEKDRQLNELKTAFKALLRWLEEHGVQGYPKPPAELLETDPRVRAIRNRK